MNKKFCMLIFLSILNIVIFSQDKKTAFQATEITGPMTIKTPMCKWGSVVKDELNNEWVWFGGTGGVSETGALLTYIFKDGQWKRGEFANHPLQSSLATLKSNARKLYSSIANRYYVSETDEAKKVDLAKEGSLLSDEIKKLKFEKNNSKSLQENIIKNLEVLKSKLGSKYSTVEIEISRNIWVDFVKLDWSIGSEPAPRNYASLAFDNETKKIVLFGGEGEFGACNDTWIYDCATRKWSEIEPVLSPSPRLGHGSIAFKGKCYVVGGFEPFGSMSYCAGLWSRLPFDVWEFSIATGKWTYLKEDVAKRASTAMQPSIQLTIDPEGKSLSWLADVMSYGKKTSEIKGSFDLPGADIGTEKVGVMSGTLKVRELGFDPAWYEKVPPADENAFQEKLKNIPVNKWFNVAPPVLHVNRDWGTTVLDIHRDQLLHWAGGHSSHCGTDVAHFSLATGRWHILYTPELPFEYCYSNDGAPVPPLTVKPWGPHSYLSYAYDIITQKMIWAGSHGATRITNPFGLWTYDPETYEWSNPQWKINGGKFDVERHKTCMASTPSGIAVWADKRGGSGGETGLWLANVKDRVFEPIVGTDPKDGTTLPFSCFGDGHGNTYDSKRNCVYILNFKQKENKNKIWSVDLKTKTVTVLEPKNSDKFPLDANMARECTYIPDYDIMIVPTSPQKTLIYDCDKNEWHEMAEPGTLNKQNVAEPLYGVSTGVEWDAKRKLLWLVQTNGAVYAMRLDISTIEYKPY